MTTFSLNSQILNEKERADKINQILKNRFDNVLPELMDKTEIDMWILISREYNEDPVLRTMLPAEWLNARRRTIIVFFRDKVNDSLDKLAVARYNFGDNIISAWDKDKQPDQWKRLNENIRYFLEFAPKDAILAVAGKSSASEKLNHRFNERIKFWSFFASFEYLTCNKFLD